MRVLCATHQNNINNIVLFTFVCAQGEGQISEFEGYFNPLTNMLFCRLVHPVSSVNPLNRYLKDLRARSFYVFLVTSSSLELSPGTTNPIGNV